MDSKTRVFSIAGLVLVLAVVFSLFFQLTNEKKARLLREAELKTSNDSLNALRTEMESIAEGRRKKEGELSARINRLEGQLKESEETIRRQSAKLADLTTDNETLQSEKTTQAARISSLEGKIRALEKEKQTLSQQSIGTLDYDGDPQRSVDLGSIDVTPRGTKLVTEDVGTPVTFKPSGRTVQVQYVSPVYGFVILTGGEKEGLIKDNVINFVRGNRLIGKGIVQKNEGELSAAVVLHDWTREKIAAGDLIYRP